MENIDPLTRRYLAIDHQEIEDMCLRREAESLHLEFSTAPNHLRTPDEKRSFAKTVSAFANSEGGIIVWGVVAQHADDGIDAASEASGIESPAELRSTLERLTADSTSPICSGIQHRLIDNGSNRKYVVTLVPESNSGPHMAKLGDGRYFKRSGSQSRPMEHFDIADMFGRRARPRLAANLEFLERRIDSYPSVWDKIEYCVRIENKGKGIAKFPYLRLRLPFVERCNWQFFQPSSTPSLPERPLLGKTVTKSGRVLTFAGGQDQVVHPDTYLDVCRLQLHCPAGSSFSENILISLEVGAEGVAINSQSLELTAIELNTKAP